jgi:phosphatidylinositol-4,5-bisphosphate 3-kinase
MLSTGIPELTKEEDINYLREKLYLDVSEEKASEAFIALIEQARSTTMTQINDWIHMLAH